MSLIHHLYIGHFEHAGKFVRFSHALGDPILRPVVSRPLDMDVVKRVVRELKPNGCKIADSQLPDDWPIWVEDGYLACDQCALTGETRAFIVRLAQLTNCDLVDFNSRSNIGAEDLLRAVRSEAASPGLPQRAV